MTASWFPVSGWESPQETLAPLSGPMKIEAEPLFPFLASGNKIEEA